MASNRRPKLDKIDVELLDELLNTSSYRIIEKRIRLEIERNLLDIEHQQNEITTATLRGTLAGLRLALRIPQILKTEAGGNTNG